MVRCLLIVLLFALSGCGNKAHHGAYSIGRDPTWYPIQIDALGPNLNGFTDALIQEIAKAENVPLQIVDIDTSQLLQSLQERIVAAIFTGLDPNVITLEKYTFSHPLLQLGPVLIVPEKSDATSLKDLGGKIVSVNQFDNSVLIVQKHPSIVVKLYENMPTVLEELKEGQIDGVLMPILDARKLVNHLYSGQLKIVTAPLDNQALRVMTLKGKHLALIKYFNRGLEKIYSSGKYTHVRKTFQLD